jgi:hypothetical protein
MSPGTETVLRAHFTVATIGGAYGHPGQTDVQARSTNSVRPLCWLLPLVVAYFHAW